MAITPSDACAFSPDLEAEVKGIEAEIDKMLRAEARHHCYTVSITVAAKAMGSCHMVREEVARRFRAAGWSVERKDDQRDGSYYLFAPAPERSSYSGCRD